MFDELAEKWEDFRDWWKERGPRQWINDNPKVVITVACVSAAVLVGSVFMHSGANGIQPIEQSKKQWYYDLNTGELFVAAKGLAVPTKAPSGSLANGEPAGVRACVLSFALEPSESEQFIGFLEKPDPNATSTTGGKWSQGRLIRRVEDRQWFAAESRQGRAIMEDAFIADVNGERPSYVRPK